MANMPVKLWEWTAITNSINLWKLYETVKWVKETVTSNGQWTCQGERIFTQDNIVWRPDAIVLELIALIKKGELFNSHSQVFLEGVKYIIVAVRRSRPLSLQRT